MAEELCIYICIHIYTKRKRHTDIHTHISIFLILKEPNIVIVIYSFRITNIYVYICTYMLSELGKQIHVCMCVHIYILSELHTYVYKFGEFLQNDENKN